MYGTNRGECWNFEFPFGLRIEERVIELAVWKRPELLV